MNLLIIDNFDSFTYNLKHLCEVYVKSINIIRNNMIRVSDVKKYDKIIISPGPGLPVNAGHCSSIIRKFYKKKPILGVCLGAQAIAELFGCKLINLEHPFHGKQSLIYVSNDQLYTNMSKKIKVGRYHSWAIDLSSSKELITTAVDKKNTVMSFKHIKYPLTGIQYHPESILTPYGDMILKNWLLD